MEKQAVASIVAASTAQRSAAALINSERAWILAEEIEHIPTAEHTVIWYSVTIRNRGRTPGRITLADIQVQQVPEDGRLPPEPVFNTDEETVNFMLPPNGHVSFLNAGIAVSDFTAIRQGAMLLYICGFVRYIGVENEPRETRFCYKYHIPGELDPTSEGMFPALDVPTAYTECT